MATGTQVPWTSPGGTKCCCTPCTSNLLNSYAGSNNIQKVFLTQEQYDLLIGGFSEAYWRLELLVRGNTFATGEITSTLPDPLVLQHTFTFGQVANSNANPCVRVVGTQAQGGMFLYNNNVLREIIVVQQGPLIIILQGTGQGRIGVDAPIAQPAIYVSGFPVNLLSFAGVSVDFTGNGLIETNPNNIGTSEIVSSTAFGSPLPITMTVSSGLHVKLTFTMDFSAP